MCCSNFEPSFQISSAQENILRQLLYRDFLLITPFDIILCFQDVVITMLLITLENHELRLIVPPHINSKYFGDEDYNFMSNIFFKHIENKVEIAISSATAIDTVLVRHDLIANKIYLWKHFTKFTRVYPVSSTTLSV